MKEKKFTAKVTETHTESTIERSIEFPVMEGYVDVKLPEKHRFNNGQFVTVFQKELRNIAMFGSLTKNEAIMLLYLIGSCTQDNSICIDLNVLSEDLGIQKSNISSALKGLVNRNIVLRRDGYRYGNNPVPMELRLNYDQINYNVAYKGKIQGFQQSKQEHPQITESDGRTLLEDHRNGQPYKRLQEDGTMLLISTSGEILNDDEHQTNQD